jgi:hypothetical protein
VFDLANAKRPCEYCGEPFVAIGNTKYCSSICKQLAKDARDTVKEQTCKWCGGTYPNTGLKFCSTACEDAYNKAHAKPEPPKVCHTDTLIDVVKQARDCGLSYGQYVGRLYAHAHPIK